MTEAMGQPEHAQRPQGIDEERVRAVEGVNVAAVTKPGPPSGLHSAGDFEREFAKITFLLVLRNFALLHQTKQIAVRRNIVKPMVVHADVRDMGSHVLDGFGAANLQKTLLS